MELRGAAALVTGAASGLGAATAAHLVSLGLRVVGFDLENSLPAVRAWPGQVLVPVDVTAPKHVAEGLDIVDDLGVPLRVVVNCAGIAPSARILSARGPHDLELFAKVVQVNLVGTFNVLTLAAQRMVRGTADDDGQRGVVINTASIAAYEGQVGQAAYSSSKGGVVALTLAAARDLAQHGIRVNAIAPGTMETPMLETVSEEYRAALAASIPLPSRLGRPEEYARAVAFLAEHNYINGEVLRMDGALRMAPR